MSGSSSIPAWLYQIAPRWLTARPAFFEFAYIFAATFGRSALTVLYSVWAAYNALTPEANQTWAGYWVLVGKIWFSIAAPIFWAIVQGRNAGQKAMNASTSSS